MFNLGNVSPCNAFYDFRKIYQQVSNLKTQIRVFYSKSFPLLYVIMLSCHGLWSRPHLLWLICLCIPLLSVWYTSHYHTDFVLLYFVHPELNAGIQSSFLQSLIHIAQLAMIKLVCRKISAWNVHRKRTQEAPYSVFVESLFYFL